MDVGQLFLAMHTTSPLTAVLFKTSLTFITMGKQSLLTVPMLAPFQVPCAFVPNLTIP